MALKGLEGIIMKNEIKAKELMRDPNCADCDCLLNGDDIVVLFQDNQSHDLRDGYYCEKCADKYDENGIMENYEPYEMAVTHYLDTVDNDERKAASADAEKMEQEYGIKWPVIFCKEYGLTVYN